MTGRNGAGRGTAWLAVAAVAVAGCGDASGPATWYDPIETVDQLEDVLVPLESEYDFLLGLDLAVSTLEHYSAGFLADAVSLRTERQEGLLGSLRAGNARVAGSPRSDGPEAAGPGVGAFTIPWELEGETLEWDAVDGYVVTGRSGAPWNGVRLYLYRMDDRSGYPLTPVTPVGYMDITDEDGSDVEALRVRAVRTEGADRVIADYRVTLSGSGNYDDGSMEITTRGAFGSQGSVTLDISERLVWSRYQDRDELTMDYRYTRGNRSVRLEGWAEGPFEAVEFTRFDFDLSFRGGARVTEIEADIGSNGSVDGWIRSDGQRAIRITGYDTQPTFRREGGRELTATERSALAGLWTGIGDLIWYTDWIAVPAELLIMGG